MNFLFKKILICAIFVVSQSVYGQTVIDDIGSYDGGFNSAPLATEKIEKVSISKRIYIITNNERSFDKGDFISLIVNSQLASRALVAKSRGSQSGIKILKIYDLDLWNTVKEGTEVKVLRGDDSGYKKSKSDSGAGSLIQDEDDLFNETAILEDDLDIDDNKKRVIKTDNLISLGLGKIEALDTDGSPQRYTQINLAWAYQIEDNIYIEGVYGQNLVNDYPAQGLDTKLTNLIIRGKYTLKAPAYSFIQPYVGFQILSADSPGAGQQDPIDTRTEAELELELQRVEDVRKKSLVFGITLLKRLVPGWFFRADLGSDILSAGFSLEF